MPDEPIALWNLPMRLRDALCQGTELRVAPNRGLFLVRVEAAGEGYWVGFPMPREQQPWLASVWRKA
jgi:hypothetical protein